MILSAIAAMSKNRVIGKNNKLPWDYPEDMKFFKDMTKGKILIMGRKTYESLPGPLPNRFHIVVSRNQNYDIHHPMVEVVSSLNYAFELIHMIQKKYPNKFSDEVMVCGGSEIYSQSLPFLNNLYLTVIDKDFDGDAFFPKFEDSDLELVNKRDSQGLSFLTYARK